VPRGRIYKAYGPDPFVICRTDEKGQKKLAATKDGVVMRFDDIDDAIKVMRGTMSASFRNGKAKVMRESAWNNFE
jgi:nitrous oxide reductase accessory protein NosL